MTLSRSNTPLKAVILTTAPRDSTGRISTEVTAGTMAAEILQRTPFAKEPVG
jgi:hypothetical protein